MQKTLYLLSLALAFFGSALFYTNLRYQGDTVVVFHLDAFGVTWHHITNVAIIGMLLTLFVISWRKFLVSYEVKHKTEIARK